MTKNLGDLIRNFVSNTCSSFAAKELPRETEARRRRQVQQNQKKLKQPQGVTRQLKTLNLQTYKLHALADYPSQIRLYGTTDSYSTQSVRMIFFFTNGGANATVYTGRA